MKALLWIVLVLTIALAACSPSTPEAAATATPATATKVFDAAQYAGTYRGTWTNNTTGATGPASLTIALDEAAKTASLTLDFDGNYLGLENPPAQTLTGTYDDSGAKAQGSSIVFGDYDVTIDPDGNIVGLMKNLAAGVIPEMSYTGKLTATSLDADYTVTFADGKTSNAVLQMTK